MENKYINMEDIKEVTKDVRFSNIQENKEIIDRKSLEQDIIKE